MEVFSEICKWITIALTIYIAPLTIWTAVALLKGLSKQKQIEPTENKKHSFAVLICARNEENVIGNLLKSINKQDYEGKYHVFVVADNCTDNTAGVAGENGATVFERFDETKKGKGYALEFGLKRITKLFGDEVDAVCVFDADNLVDASFLTEMNKALCADAEVALGYRDTKNIHDSWVSEVYSLYWLMLIRFYHAPRYSMGLSSMVGGTGFAFKLSALDEGGWITKSITEDVEFSIQQILKGNRIIPAVKAVFYDEQPADFGVSVKQRMRWMTGGMQCIPLYMKQVVGAIFKGNAKSLDIAWYLLFIPAAGLTLPLNISSALMALSTPILQPFALPFILGGAAAGILVAMLVAYATLKLERRDIASMRRAILLYPIFMFTMMCISFAAILNPHTEWVPIRHKSTHTIEEMKRQVGENE